MKISFCTTCMGRLYHLKETLPLNLRSVGKADCEFVLLNYGSRDGLHEWVKASLRPWIDKGIVKYFRTREPKHFFATHAKNIAHRQAEGDILVNLDADNFLVEGYCEYLIDCFKKQRCVVTSPPSDMFGVQGSCGKIAVLKKDFYSVNGYDEGWSIGWGWDDTDFQYRVRMHNQITFIESNKKWCRTIIHSNEVRTQNFPDKNILRTQKMSQQRIQERVTSKEYVVNVNRNWGYAADLSSDLT